MNVMTRPVTIALCLMLLPLALVVADADAQSLGDFPETPAMSLAASVSQTVGITEMSVAYSSPAGRGREIWGGLVPYGELWRAGANAPTAVTFAHDVTIGGSPVPAGTYTLMVIPEAESWTFIFNSDSSGRGVYQYDPAEDVARVTSPVDAVPFRERLLFLFDGTTNSTTDLTLDWAGMAASVEITVATDEIVDAQIGATLDSLWRPHFRTARYLLDTGGDLDEAASLMATSIEIQSNWWNHWFMAKIQEARGDVASAGEHASTALELGGDDATFNRAFRADVEASIEAWTGR